METPPDRPDTFQLLLAFQPADFLSKAIQLVFDCLQTLFDIYRPTGIRLLPEAADPDSELSSLVRRLVSVETSSAWGLSCFGPASMKPAIGCDRPCS